MKKNIILRLLTGLFFSDATVVLDANTDILRKNVRKLSDYEIENKKKDIAEAHGLKEFNINGIKVMALNRRVAEKKVAKIKQTA
jgi:hypothetical protein